MINLKKSGEVLEELAKIQTSSTFVIKHHYREIFDFLILNEES